ncbi:restriction endonuclease, partial [bacterium]|nr:restriction endonuclease [bacterium]
MAIPDYQSLMLPFLESISDGSVHNSRDIIETLAKRFELSSEERKTLLPSGTQLVFGNRVAWAKTYLKHAGLLNYPQRGTLQIAQRGLDVLKEKPPKIDISFLDQYPEFIEFRTRKRKKAIIMEGKIVDQTPEELLENEYQKLKENTEQELLEKVKH